MRHFEIVAKLVRAHGFTRGAEVGVRYGQSLRHLIANCPGLTMVAVDAWKPQPNHPVGDTYADMNHAQNEAKVRQLAAETGRVEILKGDSAEMAARVAYASLDFVFIDAGHDVMSVFRDIQAWWPKVRLGGMLFGDDYNWPSVAYVVDRMMHGHEVHENRVWVAARTDVLAYEPPDLDDGRRIDQETHDLFLDGRLSQDGRPVQRQGRPAAAQHDEPPSAGA